MDTPQFVKSLDADQDKARQAQLAQVFDAALSARVDDVKQFAVAEPGRTPSGGCIKIKSLLGTAALERPELSDAALTDYVVGKARDLHAVFIGRMREELKDDKYAAYIDAARKGDTVALGQIQVLMETIDIIYVEQPVFDKDGKQTGTVPVENSNRGYPITRIASGIEGGRNGARFDAIMEALS